MSQWAPSGCVWSGFLFYLFVRSLRLIPRLCAFFSSNMNRCHLRINGRAACFSMGGRFDLCFIFISTDRFLIAFERAKRPTLPFQWPHDRIHIYLLVEIDDFYFLPFWVFFLRSRSILLPFSLFLLHVCRLFMRKFLLLNNRNYINFNVEPNQWTLPTQQPNDQRTDE